MLRIRSSAAILMLCLLAAACPAAGTPEDMLMEAQRLENAGSVQQAADKYESFLKQYTDHSQVVDAHYRLGKCYDALGMVDQAVGHLKAVTSSDKKNFRGRQDAFYALGKLQASTKNYDGAIATYEAMLGEGAGIYEDEVLGLCGGYYAIAGKYDEAAAKFNLLRRKGEPLAAEPAAYKLALLWLKAGKMDSAVDAINDLAQQFPANGQIPELMLKAADVYRTQKKLDKTIALCEQLKSRYPKSYEAMAGNYLLGLCYREKQEPQKAADVLDAAGKVGDVQGRAIAAEAVLAAADIYLLELNDAVKAMQRYADAAHLARDSDSDRREAILEQCYFRIAEHYYQEKNYAVALENYTLLRNLGTKINVLGRILACQAALNKDNEHADVTEGEAKSIQERIAAQPGTSAAAEGQTFLLDRKLAEAFRRNAGVVELGTEYEKLMAAYPREVLGTDELGAYLALQAGVCLANAPTRPQLVHACECFEQALAFDTSDANPYTRTALENIATVAERAGDKAKSLAAYRRLMAMSKAQLEKDKNDQQAEQKTLAYMKSIVSRSDTADLVDQSIDMTRKIIEERGPLSDLSRQSRFYLGELYYLKKDYSAAARAFGEFVQIYGPKQGPDGNVIDGPWQPAGVDEKVQQVYEAAGRIAHAWYQQGHDQNLAKAYEWIVRNFPVQNKYMAEAQYWLAMETARGEHGLTKEGKKKTADILWKGVVGPSVDFGDPKMRKAYHFWVAKDQYAEVQQYVKCAILKAGQLWSEIGNHDMAAEAFNAYVELYPVKAVPGQPGRKPMGDEMDGIAHYALGREYIAMNNTIKLIEAYKPYCNGRRDDHFRLSALRLLGYQSGQAAQYAQAVEAYATILDEYGPQPVDKEGRPMAIPVAQRLRRDDRGWDGIRLDTPKDLDLGEIRFALGFLYWKQEDFAKCAQALGPFAADDSLKSSKSRPQALYMTGQCLYRAYDYENGVKPIAVLIREHPHFEAIEEAYVYAARGYFEVKNWTELDLICRTFINEWPRSDRRARIDLYAALSQGGQGKTAEAMATLKSIARADTYEDVKADANYALAMDRMNTKDYRAAKDYFDKSLALPREQSMLDAARCAMALADWKSAKDLLDRVSRDFPKGDARILAQAQALQPAVQKEIAKKKD